jgi:hypothetical protein
MLTLATTRAAGRPLTQMTGFDCPAISTVVVVVVDVALGWEFGVNRVVRRHISHAYSPEGRPALAWPFRATRGGKDRTQGARSAREADRLRGVLTQFRQAAQSLQGRLATAVAGLASLMAGVFSHMPQSWAALAIFLGVALLLVTVVMFLLDVIAWLTRRSRPAEPTPESAPDRPVAVRLRNSNIRMSDNIFVGYDTAVDATDSTVEGSGNVVVGPQAITPDVRPNRAARRSRPRTKRGP